MEKEELMFQIEMPYKKQIAYLLKKYGCAKYDYFYTKTCKSKNSKVSRTQEGLYCHHIREDVALCLCEPNFAIKYPFEYQKAENLVYCNLLEHLVLHVKISLMNTHVDFAPGVYYISQDINDMFKTNGELRRWQQRCFLEIQNNYCEYLQILVLAIDRLKKITQEYYDSFDINEEIEAKIELLCCGRNKVFYKNIATDLKMFLSVFEAEERPNPLPQEE